MEPVELSGAYAELDALIRLRHLRLHKPRKHRFHRARQAGARLSRMRGRGMDFAEVRSYEPGDDIRHIDWRVTARTGKAHTKIYREERERPTMIVIDQSQSMFFGTRMKLKSVAAAEAAALLGWQALASGDRVGGVIFDNAAEHVLRPYRSSRTLVRFLHRISRSNRALAPLRAPPRAEGFAAALERMRGLTPVGYRIHLISDFVDFGPHYEALLVSLARHNSVVVFHVSDPMEQELPPPGSYVVRDASGRFELDASGTATRSRYREAFAKRSRALEERCHLTGIQCIYLGTDQPIADQISTRLNA